MKLSRTTIVIVEDHPLFGEALHQTLSARREIEIVGMAGDGAQGLDLIRRHTPDIALLDLWLPEMSGVEVSTKILEKKPSQKIIWLSSTTNEGYLALAKHLGVAGCVDKSYGPEVIFGAIDAVLCGGSAFHLRASQLGQLAVDPPVDSITGIPLSSRQLSVLQLMCRGLSNKQIAAELGIGQRTVETHRTCVYIIGVSAALVRRDRRHYTLTFIQISLHLRRLKTFQRRPVANVKKERHLR